MVRLRSLPMKQRRLVGDGLLKNISLRTGIDGIHIATLHQAMMDVVINLDWWRSSVATAIDMRSLLLSVV